MQHMQQLQEAAKDACRQIQDAALCEVESYMRCQLSCIDYWFSGMSVTAVAKQRLHPLSEEHFASVLSQRLRSELDKPVNAFLQDSVNATKCCWQFWDAAEEDPNGCWLYFLRKMSSMAWECMAEVLCNERQRRQEKEQRLQEKQQRRQEKQQRHDAYLLQLQTYNRRWEAKQQQLQQQQHAVIAAAGKVPAAAAAAVGTGLPATDPRACTPQDSRKSTGKALKANVKRVFVFYW
jgi:hypothetical protein